MKTLAAHSESVPPAARVRGLLSNDLLVRLAAGFGVGIVTRFAILLMEVVIGRKLGSAAGYGTFSWTLGLITLCAALGSLGWLDAVTRFVAQFAAEKRWGLLHGALIRSRQIVIGSTTLISLGIGGAAWLYRSDSVLSMCLTVAALCLPFFAMKQLRCRQLQGLHRPKLGMVLDEGAIPLLVIPFLFFIPLENAATPMAIYAAMTVIVLLVAARFVNRITPEAATSAEPKFQTRTWTMTGLSLTAGQSFGILRRVDVLIIAPFLGWDAAGCYVSAFRISLALQCIPMVIEQIVRPIIADAWFRNDIRRVRSVFYISLLASTSLAIPVGALLLLFPDLTVEFIFGGSFAGAVPLLIVFVISQVFNAMTGPVGGFLAMTGHERQFGYSSMTVAGINLVMMLIATPVWGIMGAAISAALGIFVLNLVHLRIAIRALNRRMDELNGGAA